MTETVTVTAGARLDYYSDFGNSLNPRLGLNWRLHPRYSLRALYGTAFRAPDFRSLFLESPFIQGNPDLREERVRTFEIGFSGNPIDPLTVGITLFHNALKELIDVPGGVGEFDNIGSQTSRGIELEARWQWYGGAYIGANYSYVDSRLEDDRPAPDEPRNSAGVVGWIPITERLAAGGNLYWQDASPRAAADARPDLPGYTVADANLSYRLRDGAQLRLAAYNLFDRDYALPAPAGTIAEDYAAPGRSLLAELRLAF